ncbi:MAG: hypothetical protein EOO09_19605 [Chitinophagaceae bacterium]|nr:MAG: hypothetical protein EOO09_19605 [Chitinophagaceae bacterium]
MLRRHTFLCVLVMCSLSSKSQDRILPAVKTTQPPAINGILDDAAWAVAPIATGFTQNFPNVGKPASQRTEVRVLYDNTAIYIGARLYDDPALIRSQITARDEEQLKDLDFFSVFIDTYNDQQNGFQFGVTSSNVQTDARLAPNLVLTDGNYGDKTWDAVWDSKVSVTSEGWVVEMKIPFLSLRFAKGNTQDWGIQFLRSVRRNNERTFWNPVNPQVNGFVNQFGLLRALQDIRPPLRLNFSPYISTGVRSTPDPDGYNNEWLRSGGMDVKWGLNESFTLDATLIPDFGQVISDNVVNNLTPYEVRFDEYRPFFTEGTEIFNKSGLFYSRRIGAAPAGYESIRALPYDDPDKQVVRNPRRTQLVNAIKFSGRTPKKLGIGFFNAIGANMYASVRDRNTGVTEKIRTEPLTNYNIFVLDQALKGRSYLTFTNTNVVRAGAARDANVTGLDFSLYDRANTYNLRGYGHYSSIFSDNGNNGFNTMLRAGKVSGRIQYQLQNIIRSAGYDPTDLGYLQTANQHVNQASVSYNEFNPSALFINYRFSLTAQYSRLYKPDRFNTFTATVAGEWVFKNFWEASLTAGYLPDQHDYFIVGAPFEKFARRPEYGYLNLTGSTDSRKKLLFTYNALVSDFFKNPEKKYYSLQGLLRYRFSDRFSLELSHRFETETDYIISGGRDAVTNEPAIAFVDFKDSESILSGIYNFTPRINLTLRMRHYWSHVPVKRVMGLDGNGNATGVPLMSTQVDNINYLNTDAFLTWDFRYGSRLILGYKNWVGDEQYLDGNQYKRYLSNFGRSFDLKYGNELTVRFIYFLDYNQLKKNKGNRVVK